MIGGERVRTPLPQASLRKQVSDMEKEVWLQRNDEYSGTFFLVGMFCVLVYVYSIVVLALASHGSGLLVTMFCIVLHSLNGSCAIHSCCSMHGEPLHCEDVSERL